MFEIDCQNAAEYLRDHFALGSESDRRGPFEIRELAGGVSNVVLLATPTNGQPLVLKQARGKLRVKDEWLCPVERIWREADVLRICGEVLARGDKKARALQAIVPAILWEDRGNYLYAMTAAPAGHRTWKELLLAGELDLEIAAACGTLLAKLHGGTWRDAAVAAQLDDRSFFEQLRLDPYYRQIARIHADLDPQVARLIDSVWQHRRCLVHGDFSPKNLLVSGGQITLIDFEVGHYGDPAFDLGFFLTHLVLKALWAGPRREAYWQLADGFWRTYREALVGTIGEAEFADLERRMLGQIAGCLLARVDGKSPVDYLSIPQQASVRQLSRTWLQEPLAGWEEIREPVLRAAAI